MDDFIIKLRETEILTYPYDHIDILDILDEKLFDELAQELDNMNLELFSRLSSYSKSRFQIEIENEKDHIISKLPLKIKKFVLYLLENKKELFDILSKKNITDRDKNSFKLKIYLAKDLKDFWIGPHPDASSTIYTCLLYLPINNNNKDLGTEMYSKVYNNCKCSNTCKLCNGKNKNIKNVNEKTNFKLEKHIQFFKNRLFIFAPGNNTWHGVRQIKKVEKSRNSIQFLFVRN